MSYTPLINEAMFDGPKADILATCSGIIALVLVVAGASIIISIIWKKGH
jgi:hypothetical protein